LTCQIPTSCLPKSGGYHRWALAHSSSCCISYYQDCFKSKNINYGNQPYFSRSDFNLYSFVNFR
jgi:hypothetical protein